MQRFPIARLRLWAQPSLMSLALAASIAQAAPGDLDTSFAGKGWTTTEIGTLKDARNVANGVIEQTDGKVVIAGVDNNGSNDDFLLMRFTTAGVLDTTFGGDGRVTTPFAYGQDIAYSVIQQADGKIVAAGSAAIGTSTDAALARYNANGTIDTTFGNNGLVTTAIATGSDEARAVIQQTDGKLVIAGSGVSANSDVILARYNSDGSLDTTFGTGGKVKTSVLSGDDYGYSLIQQSADGKLVVAGGVFNGNDFDITLLRYNTNGTLDTTFDTDGKVTTGIGINTDTLLGADDYAYDIVQQADGKLAVAGSISNGTYADFLIVRYTSNGALDTTFDTDGYASTTVSAFNEAAFTLTLQADGKLLASGFANVSNFDFASVRYNSDGSLDTSFSTDGIQTTAFSTNAETAYTSSQQVDGKLLVAGVSKIGTSDDVAILRYNLDGSLDTTFSTDGKQTATGGTPESRGSSILQQADGKIVVTGYSYQGTSPLNDVTLARYNLDGSLDTTFSADGIQNSSFGATNDFANAVIQQADGKLVTAGYKATTGSNYDIIVSRYNTDGSPDTGFASSGKYSTGVNANIDAINDIIQLQNGKLMAAGQISSSASSSSSDFGLFRFSTTGSRDNTFNSIGSIASPIGTASDIAYSLVEQKTDGKLILAGTSFNGTDDDIAIARYSASGALDATFGTGGKVTIDLGAGNDRAFDIILQSDNKIVIVGSAAVSGSDDFIIARFNNDGSIDSAFGGGDGILTVSVGSGTDADFGFSVAQQPDGKLVASGHAVGTTRNDGFVLRINSDGTLDTSFGTGGKAFIPTGLNTTAKAMTILKDGKYAIAAGTTGPTNFLVARVVVEDTDSDGLGDAYDNCPVNANADQADFDGDLTGDACDSDADGDSAIDTSDNCLMLANPDQLNTDGDDDGNACDSDDDNDGVVDGSDAFPLNPAESVDTDSDGVGNNADGDDDGDGAADTVDTDPLNAAVSTEIDLPLDSNYDGSTVKDSQAVQ